MKEAMFYEKASKDAVRCRLCNHFCLVEEGARGQCGVRENRQGKLYSMVYGKIVAAHADPVEKKPLYHFMPGARAFSIGTVGCNFQCEHCQNSFIAQYPREHQGEIIGNEASPEEIVAGAKSAACAIMAYTYTEPTIFYEFALDTARLAQGEGLKNVFVSNGYLSSRATRHMAPFLHGINVDLKSFSDEFYKEVCGARLKPVLKTIQETKDLGVWVEVTTLVIPGLNDKKRELREIARFLKALDPAIPWHVTAFHPAHRMMDRPPTPRETLLLARDTGLEEGLRHVYMGNLPNGEGQNTCCSSCGTVVVERRGGESVTKNMERGRCSACGQPVAGVWS